MYGHLRWLHAQIHVEFNHDTGSWRWQVIDGRDNQPVLSSGGCKTESEAREKAQKFIFNEIKELRTRHYLRLKSENKFSYRCHHCGHGQSESYDINSIFLLLSEITDDCLDVRYIGYIENDEMIESGWKHEFILCDDEYDNIRELFERYYPLGESDDNQD